MGAASAIVDVFSANVVGWWCEEGCVGRLVDAVGGAVGRKFVQRGGVVRVSTRCLKRYLHITTSESVLVTVEIISL